MNHCHNVLYAAGPSLLGEAPWLWLCCGADYCKKNHSGSGPPLSRLTHCSIGPNSATMVVSSDLDKDNVVKDLRVAR